MNKQQTLLLNSLTVALSLSLTLATDAEAQKLNATPLPTERQQKDFSQEPDYLPTSRWQRRPDYRDVEALKKQQEAQAALQAEQAKQQAAIAAQKAQQQQITEYKNRLKEAVDANNQAVTFGKAGNWVDAIAQHEKAVELDPQNKQYRINLSAARTAYGKQKLAAGDLLTATSLFRKALSAASDNALAGRLLAESMKKQGLDPASADIRLATGDHLCSMADYEGAAVEYQAAMQLEPSARCYVKMGDIALQYGQVSTAINWYRQAEAKDPKYGPAHRQIGLVALSQKDTTGGAEELRKAVICDPRDNAAGQTLVEVWRRLVAAGPSSADNHLGLAGALQLTGDFAGAEAEYRKLEAIDPKNPNLAAGRASLAKALQHAKAEKYTAAAQTLFNQGLRREALAEISQAVMLEPRNAKFQFMLAEVLEANGDYQGAHQAYLTCVLIDPENNKEAAARMKQMQSGQVATQQTLNPMASQIAAAQAAAAQLARQQQAAYQAPVQAQAPAQAQQVASVPTKDMYEGAPAGNAAGFRTHEEPAAPAAVAAAAAAPTAATAPQAENTALIDGMSQVTEAEAQRDYSSAINLLQQIVTKNLQNAEVHHRLAVNLLADGQINEAISEFRIASALNPAKRAYSEDLARAMAIHKRSLAEAGTQESGSDTGVNAGAN